MTRYRCFVEYLSRVPAADVLRLHNEKKREEGSTFSAWLIPSYVFMRNTSLSFLFVTSFENLKMSAAAAERIAAR